MRFPPRSGALFLLFVAIASMEAIVLARAEEAKKDKNAEKVAEAKVTESKPTVPAPADGFSQHVRPLIDKY